MFDAIQTTAIRTDSETFRSRGITPAPLTTEVMLTSSRSPVVSVFVDDVKNQRKRNGNAFACVSLGFSLGLFVTCKHGVEGVDKNQVHVMNAAGERLELQCNPLLDPRRETDLAFLVVKFKKRPWLVGVGDDPPPTPEYAEELFTVNNSGNPEMPLQTIKRHGEIREVEASLFSHYERETMILVPHEYSQEHKRLSAKRLTRYRVLLLDCESGDSGSPVLGPRRVMYGMITLKLERLAMCLPSSEIARGIERILPLVQRAVPRLQR